MTDTRGSRDRRDAERRARELLSGKVAFIGDLGTAKAGQEAAAQAVDAARQRAEELLAAARVQGEQLIAAAVDEIGVADAAYAAAFRLAVEEGWSKAMLVSLGYPVPATSRRSRRMVDGDGHVDEGRSGDDAASARSELADAA